MVQLGMADIAMDMFLLLVCIDKLVSTIVFGTQVPSLEILVIRPGLTPCCQQMFGYQDMELLETGSC